LLRRLTETARFSESERSDALALLADLEEISALGTVAKKTEIQAHRCRFEFNGALWACVSCGKERIEPPPTPTERDRLKATNYGGTLSSWP